MKIAITGEREIETFGEYLKLIRQARFGETLRGMGEKHGSSKQYIEQAEKDYPISVEVLAQLCKSYKITASDIKEVAQIIQPTAKFRKLYGANAKAIWVEDLMRKIEQ